MTDTSDERCNNIRCMCGSCTIVLINTGQSTHIRLLLLHNTRQIVNDLERNNIYPVSLQVQALMFLCFPFPERHGVLICFHMLGQWFETIFNWYCIYLGCKKPLYARCTFHNSMLVFVTSTWFCRFRLCC